MFTGIISHIGVFKEYRQGKKELIIEAAEIVEKIKIGESLAVNGVCLSLVKKEDNCLLFNLSEETLRTTNLGHLRRGERLNLELPLTPSFLLSGHLITGHVDSTGNVERILKTRTGKRLTISLPSQLSPFLVPKGSIALNGVSLTVASIRTYSFEVELIPITLKNSNLGDLKTGDSVNIECDIIAKYVYNLLEKIKIVKKV